jgi:hypothetical protein
LLIYGSGDREMRLGGDAMMLRKLWNYWQWAGLFVLCPILLVPFIVAGFIIGGLFLKFKELCETPAFSVSVFVVVCVAIAVVGPRGRAQWEEQRRQKGAPPVTKMD